MLDRCLSNASNFIKNVVFLYFEQLKGTDTNCVLDKTEVQKLTFNALVCTLYKT